MKRRSFLKSLIAAACFAPTICRLVEKTAIEAPAPAETLEVNPAWVNAEYEMSFVLSEAMAKEAERIGPLIVKTYSRTSPWTELL